MCLCLVWTDMMLMPLWWQRQRRLGHVQTTSSSEVSAYLLDRKQQTQQSSKIDIPSVIDVNKNKNTSSNKKLTNQHFFKTQRECYDITLKCIIFIFSHPQKPNVPSSSQVCKTNVNKQCLFLALGKGFRLLILLAAAKSSLLHWTDNFTILPTSLTSALSLSVWTPHLEHTCWRADCACITVIHWSDGCMCATVTCAGKTLQHCMHIHTHVQLFRGRLAHLTQLVGGLKVAQPTVSRHWK